MFEWDTCRHMWLTGWWISPRWIIWIDISHCKERKYSGVSMGPTTETWIDSMELTLSKQWKCSQNNWLPWSHMRTRTAWASMRLQYLRPGLAGQRETEAAAQFHWGHYSLMEDVESWIFLHWLWSCLLEFPAWRHSNAIKVRQQICSVCGHTGRFN